VIAQNESAIATAINYFRDGHCCVIARKHRSSISELERDEYDGVLSLVTKVSTVLESRYNAEKTYLLVIGDSSPIDHLHFHLIPKHRDQCSMGVYCIGKLLEAEGNGQLAEEDLTALARELSIMVEQLESSERPPAGSAPQEC
jgi:diadenosine tetraphosphate (Ap4A) HIT family hydrolase